MIRKKFNDKEVRELALKLFRIVHGKGDAGSEYEFDCQNVSRVAGWLALAKFVIRQRNP